MNDQDNKKENILIEKDAFRNLITHTYRFGHQALRQSYEVLGICLGSISNDKHYRLKNAIPITHGQNLSINSNQQVQKILSQMKEKYSGKELEVIGLYTSHIENGFELSDHDLENLLYFQQEINPMSFIIIVNRNIIQKDDTFGLRSYHLRDVSEGEEGEINELTIEIEEPKSLQVYRWIQKFVEDYQKKNPVLIKEVMENEEKEEMDLQEIPQESVEISEELFPESTFQTISENLHQSLEEIVDRDLKTWNQGVTQGVVNGNEQLLNTIIQIKENIPMGINMVKKRVGELIEESLESFKGTIYRHIGELKNTDELIDNVNHIFQGTNDKIGKILNGKLSENSEKRNEDLRAIKDQSETLEKNISTFNNKSKEINTLIDSTRESIKEETEKYDDKLKEKIKEANASNLNSVEEMQKGISEIQEKHLQKIQDKLEKLKKVSDKIKNI